MHSETSRCAHTHLSPLLSALLVQGCPIALRAHDALWSALGCNPVMWDRAEDPALAHRKHHVNIDAVGPCVLAGSPCERAPQFTCVCVPPVLLLGVHHFRPRTVTTLLAAMRHCVNYTRCLRDLANGRQRA